MTAHEFGIMQTEPEYGNQFEKYEPEKYGCISVNDDCIEPLLKQLKKVDFYWHSLDALEKGLAYHGITLIPPSSFDGMLAIIKNKAGMQELEDLLRKAKSQNKFVIHFGI